MALLEWDETMNPQLEQFFNSLGPFQISLIAVWLFLQGAIFSPFPEELVIATLGIFVSQNRIPFWQAMLTCQIGLLPANAFMVFVGSRATKLKVLQKPMVQRFSRVVLAQGKPLIFFLRFTPLIRGVAYLSVGYSKFGVLNFFRIDFLASLIQVPLLLKLGMVLGNDSAGLQDAIKKLLVGGVIGFPVLWLIWKKFQKKYLAE